MYAAVHDVHHELLFCSHHFTDNSAALIRQGWLFVKNPVANTYDKALTAFAP